jgi:hypothetical protein
MICKNGLSLRALTQQAKVNAAHSLGAALYTRVANPHQGAEAFPTHGFVLEHPLVASPSGVAGVARLAGVAQLCVPGLTPPRKSIGCRARANLRSHFSFKDPASDLSSEHESLN